MKERVVNDRPAIEMRNRQILDYEQLRSEAAEMVHQSRKKRYEVADDLGRSKGAVSSALNNSGPKYAQLQIMIIELLSDYKINPLPARFQAVRDEQSED